jgi:hypothetical protein
MQLFSELCRFCTSSQQASSICAGSNAMMTTMNGSNRPGDSMSSLSWKVHSSRTMTEFVVSLMLLHTAHKIHGFQLFSFD